MAKKKKPDYYPHKPRKHVALDPKTHLAMRFLAKRNRRPVAWEIEGILQEAAKAAGLWPPPPEEELEGEDDTSDAEPE